MFHASCIVILAWLLAAPVAGYEAAHPKTWTLAAKLGPGSPLREALIADLTAKSLSGMGPGEAPLTRDEAQALLDDSRAQSIYGEKTISIIAPSMLKRQRQSHLNLMERFLKLRHLQSAVGFVKKHEAVLAQVEKNTGVTREVIVAILVWESRLGTSTGEYYVFNALMSQAFFIDEANAIALAREKGIGNATQRKQAKRVERIRARAMKNVRALIRQCKARGIDVLRMKGSWAGAIGFPQFMPASLRWADDGNGDGIIDLFNVEDAIASVGRYLAAHGFAKDVQKAVWRYNHEDAYVQGVLAFSDALRKKLQQQKTLRQIDGGSKTQL